MKIARTSQLTGKTTTMDLSVTEAQIRELEGPRHERRLVQDIFPDLSPAEREFLLTGYTQEDWDAMFAEDDEEEDE